MELQMESSIMEMTTEKGIYKSLSEVMKANADAYDAASKNEIEELFNFCCEGMEYDSEKFLATIFINALNKKICSDAISENTYQKKYEVSQIELFNILIDKFPFVKYSQQIINNSIAGTIGKNKVVTLIDIGVGLGTQMVNILELIKNNTSLEKLIIIGIEPFAEALSIAEKNICSYKDKVNFELEFVPVQEYAEQVDFKSLKNICGTVIVNASLALHHIQTEALRSKTIAGIKALNPVAFILTEPNVNHFESDFYSRFKNSYQHFHCLFKVIDQLEIDNQYKNGLKLFFGREIEDIIGKAESDRFEKHAPASQWIQLLKQNNFSTKNEMLSHAFIANPGVEIKYHNEGFIGFTYDNETALALIYAN